MNTVKLNGIVNLTVETNSLSQLMCGGIRGYGNMLPLLLVLVLLELKLFRYQLGCGCYELVGLTMTTVVAIK